MAAPNLMIIGAPRSGTSFLWASLARMPGVYAPPVKEPHFHLADRWPLGGPEAQAFTAPLAAYLRGRKRRVWGGVMTRPEDYAALYAPGAAARWRMEATPNYLAEGRFMAERIATRLGPDTRILVTLRDPVARAMSHYRLFCRNGWENLPFEAAIAAGPARCASGWAPTWDYLRYSATAQPLVQWRDVFGPRLMAISLDAQRFTPHETLARLADWLGIQAADIAPASEQNAAGLPDIISFDEAEAALRASGRIDIDAERAALADLRATEPALPLVSIGMPVHNGATTIRAALTSLQAQSYTALKIVVCDNASTDGTADIVSALARQDARITLKRFNTLLDIQGSYRRALNSRTGPYFMFAPADDAWSPGFVEAAVCTMQADRRLSVCCGEIEMISDDGRRHLSKGTRPITGRPQQRWRRGLLRVSDASRLYGLLRSAMLERIIPDTAPQGWDQFTAAKLALRGPVAKIARPAMQRHQTSRAHYAQLIAEQEPRLAGRIGMARHILRLCRADPEIDSRHPAGRLALGAYFLKHAAFNLPRRAWLAPVRLLALLGTFGLGGIAWVWP